MALSEIPQAQVTTRLTVFCNPRVPAAVRNQVQVGFRIKGSEVVLFEKRPALQAPHEWREMAVAKFKYVGTERVGDYTASAVIFAGTCTRSHRRHGASTGCSMRSQQIQRESFGGSLAATAV